MRSEGTENKIFVRAIAYYYYVLQNELFVNHLVAFCCCCWYYMRKRRFLLPNISRKRDQTKKSNIFVGRKNQALPIIH